MAQYDYVPVEGTLAGADEVSLRKGTETWRCWACLACTAVLLMEKKNIIGQKGSVAD